MFCFFFCSGQITFLCLSVCVGVVSLILFKLKKKKKTEKSWRKEVGDFLRNEDRLEFLVAILPKGAYSDEVYFTIKELCFTTKKGLQSQCVTVIKKKTTHNAGTQKYAKTIIFCLFLINPHGGENRREPTQQKQLSEKKYRY